GTQARRELVARVFESKGKGVRCCSRGGKRIWVAWDCLQPARSVGLDCRRTREECSMPVTARLSRKFYDKFGDDVTNELVDWFNQVDATYKSDLRELNELNFARFETRLEGEIAQAVAQLGARMAALEARVIKWMFLFWVGQAVTTVGLVFGVVRLTGR